MKLIKKYELVSTIEFQFETDSSLPDWIVRLDLYKTIKNGEIIYYPRIFRRELYLIPKYENRSVFHWLWTEESFSDLCWDAHIRAKNEEHALYILENYLNHWINEEEIPSEVKEHMIDEDPSKYDNIK